MYLKELFGQSWVSLLRNRTRSSLTMLGIAWGVVSVVLLLAFGQGLGGAIVTATGNMGNAVLVMWPGQTSMQAGGQRAGRPVRYEYEDIQAVRDEVPIVRRVSAESDDTFGFKAGTRVVSIQTRGIESGYDEMRKLKVEEGRFIEDGEFSAHKAVVVLGCEAAHRIFQGAPAVGQTVLVAGRTFEVVGVLEKKIQDSMYEGPDNEQAFIPYETYNELKGAKYPKMIVFQPIDPTMHLQALAAVRYRRRPPPSLRAHGRKGDSLLGHRRQRPNGPRLRDRTRSSTRHHRRPDARGGRSRRDEHHAGERDRAHP